MKYTTKQLGQMLSDSRRRVDLPCQICGVLMTGVLTSRKTCSMKCRHKLAAKKKAAAGNE